MQSWGKAATTRADDGNFIDDEGCQGQGVRRGNRTLYDQRAAGTYAFYGECEPSHRTSGFNNYVGETRPPVGQQNRRNAEWVQESKLVWMFAHHTHLCPGTMEHLGT